MVIVEIDYYNWLAMTYIVDPIERERERVIATEKQLGLEFIPD